MKRASSAKAQSRPVAAAILWTTLSFALGACQSSEPGQALIPGSGNAKKETTSGNEADANPGDDETPDKPAPIAGAYLTCAIVAPKEGDPSVTAGCQIRGQDRGKVNLASAKSVMWNYVPGAAAGLQGYKVELYDLSKFHDQYYFHAVFVFRPKDGAKAGLTLLQSSNLAAVTAATAVGSVNGAAYRSLPLGNATKEAMAEKSANYVTRSIIQGHAFGKINGDGKVEDQGTSVVQSQGASEISADAMTNAAAPVVDAIAQAAQNRPAIVTNAESSTGSNATSNQTLPFGNGPSSSADQSGGYYDQNTATYVSYQDLYGSSFDQYGNPFYYGDPYGGGGQAVYYGLKGVKGAEIP